MKAWLMVLTLWSLHTSQALAAENGCPEGSYSVTFSPDGGTLSILFDNFVVEAGPSSGIPVASKVCDLRIPLHLPAGTSLGVYRVDYRGFAAVAKKQEAQLSVTYALGKHPSHPFKRKLKNQNGEFLLSETLGAGLMKRVGCGEEAVLQMRAVLDLDSNGVNQDAIAALDTGDAMPKGGLVYRLDYKKCQQ